MSNTVSWDSAGNVSTSQSDQPLTDQTYIIQTADALIPNAQALADLATGILKSTTATGVVSIAALADLLALFTGTKDATHFLNGAGAFISVANLAAACAGVALTLSGALQADSYKSGDGSTGDTSDVVIPAVGTFSFKDGLFIGFTAA